METLEELKNKYKKLQEEKNNLYNKITALENQDKLSKFTVGECYLDTRQDNLIKIVSGNYVYVQTISLFAEKILVYFTFKAGKRLHQNSLRMLILL